MACTIFRARPEGELAFRDKSLFFLGVPVPLWFNRGFKLENLFKPQGDIMKKLARFGLGLALLASLGTPALAHDDATLDAMTTPNGGQLRMAGAYHLELVVVQDSPTPRENPVTVYLTDHADQKLPAAGAKGKVTLLSGKQKTEISLSPAGDNKLSGKGSYASSPTLKAIVTITFPDGRTEQARFTPLLPKVPNHSPHGPQH